MQCRAFLAAKPLGYAVWKSTIFVRFGVRCAAIVVTPYTQQRSRHRTTVYVDGHGDLNSIVIDHAGTNNGESMCENSTMAANTYRVGSSSQRFKRLIQGNSEKCSPLGHVQIVHVHHELLPCRGTVDTLSPLLHFGVQHVLRHVG